MAIILWLTYRPRSNSPFPTAGLLRLVWAAFAIRTCTYCAGSSQLLDDPNLGTGSSVDRRRAFCRERLVPLSLCRLGSSGYRCSCRTDGPSFPNRNHDRPLSCPQIGIGIVAQIGWWAALAIASSSFGAARNQSYTAVEGEGGPAPLGYFRVAAANDLQYRANFIPS